MTVFMVERDLAGITMEQLAGAQKAAIAKAEELRAQGLGVRYLRSAFTPSDGCCRCLFEAESESEVKRLNDDAGLPYRRIVEALDLAP